MTALACSWEVYQGKFNGAPRILETELEEFLKNQLTKIYPTVILDKRTSLSKIFNYLSGGPQYLYLECNGKERKIQCQITSSIFTREVYELFYDLIHGDISDLPRETDTLNSIMCCFENIRIAIPNGHLIFNPVGPIGKVAVFECSNEPCLQDRNKHSEVSGDMVRCVVGVADLTLHCLPKKNFLRNYSTITQDNVLLENCTHVITILYGKRRFFFFVDRETTPDLLSRELVALGRPIHYRFKSDVLFYRLLKPPCEQ